MEMQNREIKTVMHELKRRTLTVKKIQDITPKLRRITFTSPELSDFTSMSADDHVKVFFSVPGEIEPIMRDYTPRRFDNSTQELDLEFVLHGSGAGSTWAANAKIGDQLNIGGPRGSKIVPYNFDWYLMIGDDAALPSFSRRFEEFPAGVKVFAAIEVEDEKHALEMKTKANAEILWIYRKGRSEGELEDLKNKVLSLSLPEGDGFVWISTEKSTAMSLKETVLNEIKGTKETWIKATGYWKKESPH